MRGREQEMERALNTLWEICEELEVPATMRGALANFQIQARRLERRKYEEQRRAWLQQKRRA